MQYPNICTVHTYMSPLLSSFGKGCEGFISCYNFWVQHLGFICTQYSHIYHVYIHMVPHIATYAEMEQLTAVLGSTAPVCVGSWPTAYHQSAPTLWPGVSAADQHCQI